MTILELKQDPAPSTPLLRRWLRHALFHFKTIRGRILLVFLALGIVTSVMGTYVVYSVSTVGNLARDTFDHSLMATSYARAAGSDFARIQTDLARLKAVSSDAEKQALKASIVAGGASLMEDLDIVSDRAQSERARSAIDALRANFNKCGVFAGDYKALTTLDDCMKGAKLKDNDGIRALNLVVNYVAGDAFDQKLATQALVATQEKLNIAATLAVLVLSALVLRRLSTQITSSVGRASKIATDIAAGQLDIDIPRAGKDEIGWLMISMRVMRDNIRELLGREISLREAVQSRLEDTLALSQDGIVVTDAFGEIILANRQVISFITHHDGAMNRIEHASDDEFAKLAIQRHKHALRALIDAAAGPGGVLNINGRWLRVSQSQTREGGLMLVLADVSTLKERENSLNIANQQFDAALENMSSGLCLYGPDGKIQVVNDNFRRIYSFDNSLVHPGLSYVQILKWMAQNYEMEDAEAEIDLVSEVNQLPKDFSRNVNLKDNRVISVISKQLPDGGWIETHEDISERRRAEGKIAFLASHDVLTGLANRALLAERVDYAVSGLGRGVGFALFLLDLDHFKDVNDTFGHPMGDELLCAVANRLSALVRDVDTVSRLGGDEFAILLAGSMAANEAEAIAQRIVKSLSTTFVIKGQALSIGVSIGITLAPNDGSDGDKLLKNADAALYLAKNEGRGVARFFDMEMDVMLQANKDREADLRRAVANKELEVHYQPLLCIDSMEIAGFEALVRWRHPIKGMIPPMEFISLAEDIGLIGEIGEFVLNTACEAATHWPKSIKISVNVSVSQVKSDDFVEVVTKCLRQSRLSPLQLDLEITESLVMNKNAGTVAKLHQLREMGVDISMDDFGTGFSSLSYLGSFPFSKIKIDRSFVAGLTTNSGSRAIIEAVLLISASYKMKVTAEGVETIEQLEALKKIKCNEAQGYLFSKPMPISDVEKFISERNYAKLEKLSA
ncbi:MAG: EAL domain-containing protein [Hyphomicrobiales bacterium]|nr:EAL domain-containing protein [Hyphomicrobiales bacterium]MDE2116080.1 EAL domain-containing protein [Hyphomicrobiales bacterium]